MRFLILLATLMMFLSGCAQLRQMDVCEYYLWIHTQADETYEAIESNDTSRLAQLLRQIDEQPAPERAQVLKEAIFEVLVTLASSETSEGNGAQWDISKQVAAFENYYEEYEKIRVLCPEEYAQLVATDTPTPGPSPTPTPTVTPRPTATPTPTFVPTPLMPTLLESPDDFENSTFCRLYRCNPGSPQRVRSGVVVYSYNTSAFPGRVYIETQDDKIVRFSLIHEPRAQLRVNEPEHLFLSSVHPGVPMEETVMAYLRNNLDQKKYSVCQGQQAPQFGSFRVWAGTVSGSRQITVGKDCTQ